MIKQNLLKDNMIEVVPYIETLGTKEGKELYSTQFNLDLVTKYFANWKWKKMGDWYKLTNSDAVLEFFPNYYNIKISNNNIRLPLPKTLGDFINDMIRLDIKLYWLDWVERDFEPKDFIAKNKIKKYYQKLLNDINKDYELLLNNSENDI